MANNPKFDAGFLALLKDRMPISELVGNFVVWDKAKTNPRRGDFWSCCPFHSETTPSFHVQDAEKRYKCFGCEASGDIFDFMREHQQKELPEAIDWIAAEAGVPLPGQDKSARSTGGDDRPTPPPVESEDDYSTVPTESAEPKGKWTLVEKYDYTSAGNEIVYQVCRIQWKLPDGTWEMSKKGKPKKTFVQRRPYGDGTWVWGLREGDYMRTRAGGDWKGFDQAEFDKHPGAEVKFFPAVEHTIMRHPEVEIAIEAGRTILMPEGEKKVEALESLGFAASGNSGGSKHFTPALARHFQDADVVILSDNDDTGKEGAQKKAGLLRGIARRIRILDLARFWPECPPSGDIVDWKDAGGTSEELSDIVDKVPDWMPQRPVSQFGARTPGDIAGTKLSYDWLVKGMIERRAVIVIAAEQQTGKSFLAIDLEMKIGLGLDYCGNQTKRGLVIHHAAEDYAGVQLRVEGFRQFHEIHPDDLPFVVTGGGKPLELMSDDSVNEFIKECLAWEAYYGIKLEFISIDTLSAAAESLDEINGSEVGKVLGRVNRIARETQSTVALIHHMNAKADRVRGSTKITANVSQVIQIRQMMVAPERGAPKDTPPSDKLDANKRPIRRASLEKNKNGPNKFGWQFVMRQITLGADSDGYPITTCILEPPSDVEGAEMSPTRSRLSDNNKMVYDALRTTLEDKGMDMPPGTRVGPQIVRCAKYEDWLERVRTTWVFRETDPEKREKELADVMNRCSKALQNKGYIDRDNLKGIVWSLGRDDRKPAEKEQTPPDSTPVGGIPKDDGVPF